MTLQEFYSLLQIKSSAETNTVLQEGETLFLTLGSVSFALRERSPGSLHFSADLLFLGDTQEAFFDELGQLNLYQWQEGAAVLGYDDTRNMLTLELKLPPSSTGDMALQALERFFAAFQHWQTTLAEMKYGESL